MEPIKPPFTYAGGKKRVAPYIWSRLGDVNYYVEPFAGSAAVLLARTTAPKDELLGDAWGFVSNFWRAAKAAPDDLARLSRFIPSEADLYARHHWLLAQADDLEAKLRADPEWYDAEIAAYWAWGQNLWIGSGWCFIRGKKQRRQHIGGERGTLAHRQHVNRPRGLFADSNKQNVCSRRGIFADGIQKKPATYRRSVSYFVCNSPADYLLDLMDRVENGLPSSWEENLNRYFKALAIRLERVNLFHGDWKRCVTNGVLNRGRIRNYVTGVFLDPTYDPDLCESDDFYGVMASSKEVREWAVANGSRPDLRICLAGLEGEHAMPPDWTVRAWTNTGGATSRKNLERLWFSPNCLPEAAI